MRHLELVFEEFESLGAVVVLIGSKGEIMCGRIGREVWRGGGAAEEAIAFDR